MHFQLEYANLCLAENSRSAAPAAKNMNRGRRPAIRHKDMRRMSLRARALRGTYAAAGPENASGLQATKGRAGRAGRRATARRARLRNGIWQADARGEPVRRAVRRQKSEPRGGGRPSGTKTCAGCPCGRAHCAGCTRRPGQKTHPACRTRKGARVRGAACDCQTRSASQWDMGGRRAGRARPARRAAAMYDWEGRYQ